MKNQKKSKKIRINIFIIVIITSLILISLFFVMYFKTTETWTCLYCRKIKNEHHFFWLKYSNINGTAYSKWYTQTNPPHSHAWKKCGGKVFLKDSSTFYRSHGHYIWEVDPKLQKYFIQNASRSTIENFYKLMESEKLKKQKQGIDLFNNWYASLSTLSTENGASTRE